MKILFLSHSFPPLRGGVEIQNFNLSQELSKITEVRTIANSKGKKWLPIFLPIATLKSLFLMKNYEVCLLGNGVLAPLGVFLKIFHPHKKFFCIVHGLDITFAQREEFLARIYKKVNIPSLKKLTKLFMVGNATIEEAVKVGIKKDLCIFIPNGVNPQELKREHSRKELTRLFGKNLDGKKVIFRLGRFVPHKGTSWFIRNVMPILPQEYVLIAAGNRVSENTAGDKDDFLECERAVLDKNLQERVRLLPSLPWSDILALLNTVDLVVSPNVKIRGTMEGFGINVIEAGACGRIVVASDLEGLADAVKDGQNGYLLESENAQAWKEKIIFLLTLSCQEKSEISRKTEEYVKKNYSWKYICQKYFEEMKKFCQ